MLQWTHALLRRSLANTSTNLLERIVIPSLTARSISSYYGNSKKLSALTWLRKSPTYLHNLHATEISHTDALAMLVRYQSTEASENDFKKTRTDSAKERVISACNWQSPVLQERLGFASGYTYDIEELKEHFFILAKHFHPDSASAPPNSTEAFQQIKLAYDVLYEEMKEKMSTEDIYKKNETPSEKKRRSELINKITIQILCFAIGTMLIASLLIRKKIKYIISFLVTLVSIFTVVLFFPRIIAATILFLWQTVNSLLIEQSMIQKNAIIIIERRARDLLVRVEGISAESVPHISTEVQIMVDSNKANITSEEQEKESEESNIDSNAVKSESNSSEVTSTILENSKDSKTSETQSVIGAKNEKAKSPFGGKQSLSTLTNYFLPQKEKVIPMSIIEQQKEEEQFTSTHDEEAKVKKSTTILNFDLGVLKLVLPLPPPEEERHTSYHITVKDVKHHTTILDKTFQLSLQSEINLMPQVK